MMGSPSLETGVSGTVGVTGAVGVGSVVAGTLSPPLPPPHETSPNPIRAARASVLAIFAAGHCNANSIIDLLHVVDTKEQC
jgi:hypothetical protein